MPDQEIIQYYLSHKKGIPVFELLSSAAKNTTDQEGETNTVESLNLLAENIKINQKWWLMDPPRCIRYHGSIIGILEFVWMGDMVVELQYSEGISKIFQIISKGFFNKYYTLQAASGQILFTMETIQDDNVVTCKNAVKESVDPQLLLALFGYGIFLIPDRQMS